MPNKQDSNLTGLRYAKETSLRTLPGTPNWIQLEPNSYSDFGATYNQVARNPINAFRQRKKGALVGLEAGGGFSQDLTVVNSFDLMQGFFYADAREKATSQPLNGTAIALTATTTTAYNAASGLGSFSVTTMGNLVKGSGFAQAANNGLHMITAASATSLTTTGLVVETPPAAAKVETVGHQFGAGIAALTVTGNLLNLTATGIHSLPLIVGEWIFVGGDTAATRFDNAASGFFARIGAIATGILTFDKITLTAMPAADAAAAKTIQIFYGNVLRNENSSALIKRTSYHLERTLGVGNTGALQQAEYLEGSIPNEMTINVPQEDKVTVDFSFVSMAHSDVNSTAGPKSGNRPTLADAPAFDTALATPRIRVGKVDSTKSVLEQIFGYYTDLSATVANNVSATKAIGVLGAFDATAGNIEVSMSSTAYFQDVSQFTSIRNLTDCTVDWAHVEMNAGYLFDAPLVTLGDGRPDVQQDQSVMASLDIQAVQCPAGYTFQVIQFPYLPTLAG